MLPRKLFLPVDSTKIDLGLPRSLSIRSRHPCGPYPLRRPIHTAAPASFQCPSRLQHIQTGREFQPVYHRLRLWGLTLGSASPCADCHGAGTLGFTVCGVFTRICAYSVRHPHFRPLHDNVCHGRFTVTGTLPYPAYIVCRPSFGGPLNPDHSRRIPTRRVSYYALFKGMAASKPTSSLSQ